MAVLSNTPPPDEVQKLLAGPAGLPPLGHITDLNAPNPYAEAIVIMAIFTLLGAVCFMLMRMFTQHFASKGLVAEDYVMFVALLLYTGNCVLIILIVGRGVGKHMWNISLHDFYWAFQVVWLFAVLYVVSLALIKVAILLQFIRIFTPSRINKPIWYTCWTCIIINTVFYMAILILQILECTPISRSWDRTKSGHCIDIANIYKATAVFNIVSDFTLLAIPVPVILKLNMKKTRKLLVMTVFATGVFACVASVLRCYYTFRAFKTGDLSYNLLWMGLFCCLESLFGIIVFFTPVAAVFYTYLRSRFWSTQSASNQSPDMIEKANPRNVGDPYDMPSLASFEERKALQTNSTVKYMPTLNEVDGHSSTESKATTSNDSLDTLQFSQTEKNIVLVQP